MSAVDDAGPQGATRGQRATTALVRGSHAMQPGIESICGYVAALCLLLAVAGAAYGAAQDARAQVERKGDATLVQMSLPVAVDSATAWEVLTDYDRLAEFVPDMTVSRIVSKPGEALLLEQRGEGGFLFFRVELRVVLRIDEFPQERIAFRAISGNMRRMQGEWRLRPRGDSIRLEYRAEIEPEFWVPAFIGDAVLKANVEKQVAGVVEEMLRRFARRRGRAPPAP